MYVCSFEHGVERDSFDWRQGVECVHAPVEMQPHLLDFPGFLLHFAGGCLLALDFCAMAAPAPA